MVDGGHELTYPDIVREELDLRHSTTIYRT